MEIDGQRTRRRGDRPAATFRTAGVDPVVLSIPNWQPATLNRLVGNWRVANRLKKADRNMIFVYAFAARLDPAKQPRRVDLIITLGPGQRSPDRDAWWKSTLDALVHAEQLVDDSPRWCVPGSVTYNRAKQPATTIHLTDLEEIDS